MKTSTKKVRAVCLALFKNQKIAMVRPDYARDVLYFVGGTVEEGESDVECLIREVEEEINCKLDPISISFLEEFHDEAHGRENTTVELVFYTGDIIGEPKASSEIEELLYADSSINQDFITAVARNKVFPWLVKNGYIR